MCAQIQGLLHLAGQIGICALCNIRNPVCRSLCIREVRKLVHIPAALESEVLEGIEFHALIEERNIESSALFYHLLCVVLLVDSDGNHIGSRSLLHGRVDNTAVGFLSVFCCQDKKSVCQFEHNRVIHCCLLSCCLLCLFSLLSAMFITYVFPNSMFVNTRFCPLYSYPCIMKLRIRIYYTPFLKKVLQ